MPLLLDGAYLVALILTLPIWLTRLLVTGRWRSDWVARFGFVRPALEPRSNDARPVILIHAVSVGEVNATRHMIDCLVADARMPRIVVSTTTDTGFSRARELFVSRHDVVRYPLDFSFAVSRFLNAVRPNIAVLIELEVWPNFTAACQRRNIPVCVVNGRLSARSFSRYRFVHAFVRRAFARLGFVAAQNDQYADRFRAMGAIASGVFVTDTMKWDTARIADEVSGAAELADAMGIDPTRPLIVGGSTEPVEHDLLHRAVPSDVQVLCAPRRPEWFDEAARALPGCARRSRGDRGSATGRFLLDTFGELRLAYALADVVVVGRSFGWLHGSDMMEPVALGKATVVGPRVSDFQDTVRALRAGDGLIQTTASELPRVLRALLENAPRRRQLAENGRAVIRSHQGASARHAQMILQQLDSQVER